MDNVNLRRDISDSIANYDRLQVHNRPSLYFRNLVLIIYLTGENRQVASLLKHRLNVEVEQIKMKLTP